MTKLYNKIQRELDKAGKEGLKAAEIIKDRMKKLSEEKQNEIPPALS